MRRAITHTIRGYEVEIRPTMFGPAGHYDMYVYFLGRVPTAPSVHESIAQALIASFVLYCDRALL